MNSEKRRNVGILGSLAIHAMVFLLVAFSGVLNMSYQNNDIVEVAIYGGGGGGGSGQEEAAPAEAEPEPAPVEEAAPEPEPEPELPADAIVESNKTEEPKPAPKPVPVVKTSKGTGTGIGSGTGSGTGPGSGSGSGGGQGSGQGTGTGAGFGAGTGVASNPAIPPRILRSRQPSYPAAERATNIEGTTVLRFLIDRSGKIEELVVVQSSGNANLDQAALEACEKWRFSGAKNSAGQYVRCYANIPITFKLR